ncbi:MAG: GNAT family N-acetyltransferase [Acidimicrobiales bacterium]|nr:GNAT family N-acetyltransferase [Acidimicrobiales bacterium]MCB9392707.1 GNAT family N-acetyltransferase [Acidimicrobiaceae bacterium]
MKIRETTPADLDDALALNNANVPALNELDAPEIARLVSIAHTALTAEVDGAFAGFCVAFAPGVDYGSLNYGWFSRTYDRFVYLDRIAVDPAYRRYGIGRAFYERLIERARGHVPRITCEVNVRPMNEASLAFHHSIGFREVGQQETDGGNKTVSLLALDLD